MHPTAVRIAWVALVVGVSYAAVSVYWGTGGTRLLSTVGGEFAQRGRDGSAAILFALWAAVALKLLAAVLPLALCHTVATGWAGPRSRRADRVRVFVWLEASILVIYGGVLTTVDLLIQAGLIAPADHAEHRALAWHAYLWDPWFLIWGLLVLAVVLKTRTAARVAA